MFVCVRAAFCKRDKWSQCMYKRGEKVYFLERTKTRFHMISMEGEAKCISSKRMSAPSIRHQAQMIPSFLYLLSVELLFPRFLSLFICRLWFFRSKCFFHSFSTRLLQNVLIIEPNKFTQCGTRTSTHILSRISFSRCSCKRVKCHSACVCVYVCVWMVPNYRIGCLYKEALFSTATHWC